MTRNRLLLGLALILLTVAGVRVWLYQQSPLHAVHCLESAYAKADAAAAAPWLTPRGQALFAAGIDPDVHSDIALPKAEAQPPAGDAATVRYHGLTRFGAVDADLRLLRQKGNWRLDEVYLRTVGSYSVEAPASSLVGQSGESP